MPLFTCPAPCRCSYEYSNSLLTTSLLPAALPTLQQLATLPAHDAVNALPAIAPASISRGFELRVTAFGPPCGAPSLDVASLLGGAFKPRVTSANSTSASFVHSFACPDCAFGPLSSVRVTFPPACQAFLITAVSVGATGSVSVASVVATNPSPVAGDCRLSVASGDQISIHCLVKDTVTPIAVATLDVLADP